MLLNFDAALCFMSKVSILKLHYNLFQHSCATLWNLIVFGRIWQLIFSALLFHNFLAHLLIKFTVKIYITLLVFMKRSLGIVFSFASLYQKYWRTLISRKDCFCLWTWRFWFKINDQIVLALENILYRGKTVLQNKSFPLQGWKQTRREIDWVPRLLPGHAPTDLMIHTFSLQQIPMTLIFKNNLKFQVSL